MAIHTRDELFKKGEAFSKKMNKSVDSILLEKRSEYGSISYDIFLSHSFLDKELVLGIKILLEELGYSVYVDWIVDYQLNRHNVTKGTAKLIRERMRSCKSLFYAISNNSESSKWMPWECGYFDGYKQKVAIFPIINSLNEKYNRQEYLALYPYVEKVKGENGNTVLYIVENHESYESIEKWIG